MKQTNKQANKKQNAKLILKFVNVFFKEHKHLFKPLKDKQETKNKWAPPSGQLEKADDLFFLRYKELQALASGAQKEWKMIIANRRTTWEREKRRRQIPRLILTDGWAY